MSATGDASTMPAPAADGNGGDAEELAELLTHAARRMQRGSVAEFAPLGLTYGQARVLRMVAGADPPLRMADIAARLDVVPRAATTMVDGLEEAGLASRRPDPGDRRSILVEPTAEGTRVLARVRAARRATAEQVLDVLTTSERAALLTALRRLSGPATAEGTDANGATELGRGSGRGPRR